MPEREVKWVERMLKYNVIGGKMNRGLMVIESVMELAKVNERPVRQTYDPAFLTLARHISDTTQFQGKELSPQEISRFAVLGWAVEWMQAWLLMADDIMDDSQTRRGQPCW